MILSSLSARISNLHSLFLATMEQRPLVNSDSSGVLRLFLVQRHMPVSGRVLPQFPYWSELSLLCHSVPLTHLQGFLQYRYNKYKLSDFIFKTFLFPSVYMYSLGHSDIPDGVRKITNLGLDFDYFQQLYLGLGGCVFLPLFAVMVVLFPLLAGWRCPISVIMVKTIPQAFAMSKFTPIVITGPGCLHEQTKAGIITKPT